MRTHSSSPLRRLQPVLPVLTAVLQPRRQGFWEQALALYGGMLLLLVLALLLPAVAQPEHYHAFADQRSWLGLAYAGDVLSNLGFVLAALAGGRQLIKHGWQISGTARAMCALFFVGLACTALASAAYHLAPTDAGLFWDRMAMGVAFAGLLGLAVQTRLDDGSAWLTAIATLVAAALSMGVWSHSGNLLPWVLLQGGGMLLVLWLAFVAVRKNAMPLSLGWVIAWYGLAKLLELSDLDVFELTGGWISGHSLKHWVAAAAALPVLQAFHARQSNS